jgi:DNA-binding NtrC family response regulator
MEKKEFRILIAEDDSLVREAVRHLLTREGYDIRTAADGREAMKILAMDELDLVVTDLRMPGASGLDVLRQVQRATPETAVIIMTAYGSLETALEAMRQGAFDYLTKPFQIEQMTFAVEKAYGRALLIEENKELRRCLREAYRDTWTVKSIGGADGPAMEERRVGTVEGPCALQVVATDEEAVLRRRLPGDNGKG